MIYQHPLAYLLGIEGLALLRAWAGDADKDFVLARLAEVRRLLADEALAAHPGVDVARGDTVAAYRTWAPSYDDGRNSIVDADEPAVQDIVGALPVGDALDAACGTGRFAEWLAAQGHRVVGVDSSSDMLERARVRVPDAEFRLGDVCDLPVDDGSVDLVVCALALAHVRDLRPALAEFARVLRPGGHLVVSDAHHELVLRGSVVKAVGPNGEPGLVATYRHTPGDWLRAALATGFAVRRCEEPAAGVADAEPASAQPVDTALDWDGWPWTLLDLIPEAARAAWGPSVIVWHFQRDQAQGPTPA